MDRPIENRDTLNRAEYLPERKKMMQAWAKHVEILRQGAKVIPLRGNAA